MKKILPHLSLIICILLFSFQNLNAQRIEVHPIKDFSTNSIANKAWGVGVSVDFDQWVKKVTFRANFNWGLYQKKSSDNHPRFQLLSGGVSAFYSWKIREKISLQCGAEVNYTNLGYSYVYGVDTLQHNKPLTVQHTGNFIGIGPHVSVRYDFTPRFFMALNFIPQYLIPVSNKSSVKTVPPEYEKGVWLFPIQLGFSFKLFNNE
jgi:hypothetical protein